jgi:hypothetical protein
MKIHTFALLTYASILSFPNISYADCLNADGENICDIAKIAAELLQSQIPMRATNGITIIGSSAENNVITTKASANFNREDIEKTAVKVGIKPEEMLSFITLFTQKQTCQGNLRAFVDKGIHLRYEYVYADLTPLATMAIDDCAEIDKKELKFQ